jgi:hypothetical protein
MKNSQRIIEFILEDILQEQEASNPIETDNAPGDATESPFTPAEEKFLGKFDAYGTTHLGIVYSPSITGIREFIIRSGKDLNVTPGILLSLLRKKIVKLVPYTGFGRNDDYTIELQLSLDDVKGLGDADKEKIEAGSGASGAAGPDLGGALETPSAPEPPAAPETEVAWVVKYGSILSESAKIAKSLLTSQISEAKQSDVKIYADASRLLSRFPKHFIYHLRKMIETMDKKTKTTHEKERLIADILDNLQVNLKLKPSDVKKSYEFHKNQKRLQKHLKTK